MKKFLVLALAIVMALSVVALVACAKEETYVGDCHYNKYSTDYGCKVKVTVKGNVITKVELLSDEESGYTRTSEDWTENQHEGDLGYDKAEAAYADWLVKTFKGKTVDEVKAYQASATADGCSVTTEGIAIAGATQSSARIIVAVQDALSQIPAAK